MAWYFKLWYKHETFHKCQPSCKEKFFWQRHAQMSRDCWLQHFLSTKFFFLKSLSVVYRWKGNFILNKKFAYSKCWKWIVFEISMLKVSMMTSSISGEFSTKTNDEILYIVGKKILFWTKSLLIVSAENGSFLRYRCSKWAG